MRKKVLRTLYYLARDLYIRLIRVFTRLDDKMVTFKSFGGTSYSDNPRAISEKLYEIDNSIKIVWILAEKSNRWGIVPNYVKVVKRNNIPGVWNCFARTKVYVTNENCDKFPKHRDQCIISTWHGDRAFKKILFDVNDRCRDFVTEAIPYYCDYAITGSKYGEMQFKSAFRYQGEILKYGCPRNDLLLHPDINRIKNIREKLGIEDGIKLLLFAPTFRIINSINKTGKDYLGIDLKSIREVLKRRGDDWIILLRAHPILLEYSGWKTGEGFIDVTRYEDMADLLAISDILVTDYSSSAGDFALTGKPILLFQSDIEDYLKNDRELYFEMNSSPYYVAHNQTEAEQLLSEITMEKARKNCLDILDFYGAYETGEASYKVAQKIIEFISSR